MQGDLSYEGVNDVEQSGPLRVQVQLTLFLPFLCHLLTSRQLAGQPYIASWLNAERVKNYMGL